ncbi:murein biosynthesis integral membrane protein MurJ [Candidatus Parcubacteria bacterium]|nr:murein biosynthesis integral membrane protein MurJ [Patescibacteria group bacterium]MBU4381219.1 murein biosynthesis integral membrane protein MurJ [Patescibacteria group bacterium]MCG2689251.1 murein biosynthesis integral membrane protein MurJ [Candidatus Parcubacteria bacterium]
MTGIFFKKQESVLSAAFVISVTYLVAYFLGFIKQRVLIATFGVSLEGDLPTSLLGTFYLADRIPSLVFNVLVVGSISSAFIPVFTRILHAKDQDKAFEMASEVLNITLIAFAILSAVVFIFTGTLSRTVTLFSPDADYPLLISLIRIMMLSQFVLIVSSYLTSTLQSLKRFIIPALAPVFYNLGVIIITIVLSPRIGIYAPAYGMVFGAFLHLGIQIPACRAVGFRYFAKIKNFSQGAKEVFLLAMPRTFGMIADQISLIIDTSLAFFIAPPYTAILALAASLQRLPVSVFGASFAQALLPRFSHLVSQQKDKFSDEIKEAIIKSLFFSMPSSVVILVLRIPLVRIVYGASRFSWDATIATSYTLAFFSISIFAQTLVFILARAFYALEDTKTPLKASVISLVTGIILSLTFVFGFKFGVWSLGLSYSISVIVNLVFLVFFLLKKKILDKVDLVFADRAAKIFWASFFTGVCLYIPLKLFDQYLFDTSRTIYLLALTAIVGVIGVGSYIKLCSLFKVHEVVMVREVSAIVIYKIKKLTIGFRV